MAGIRWRVSRKALIAFTELGVKALANLWTIHLQNFFIIDRPYSRWLKT
jgi:hypothetical protein